ncbi:MAG: DALR anticodon-binding domain-containing protein [Clostridium sp.]
MLLISRYNEVLNPVFRDSSHKICQYIYELSNAFNSFYHETKILTEPDEARKDSFIGLITLARRVLETCIACWESRRRTARGTPKGSVSQ